MRPELGVCYYPEHWPETSWETDAREMRELGLDWVRIGEFAWSKIEPRPGHFEWEWLDRAVSVLGEAGLKVVMGTPTATPPRWMLDKHPDMIAFDVNGRPRKFGSRRHYCFSHDGYRGESVRITELLGERYGDNSYVRAWQTDNEYGCHETIVSYSPAAALAFRSWLKEKYQTADALNKAWGNIFWSMEYSDFTQIDLPNLTVTEANPSHVLDFRRFSSDQVVRFNRAQCEVLRRFSEKPLIHNYMGRITEFDHFDVGKDLDIASWDSYPLGFLEDRSDQDDDFKHKYMRQGDPDFQAFHHDLYRAVGKGRWWVMEQQPGPVNWAPFNPAPLPGMVNLWTWEAVAHGAEVVSYFRWRQAPFAQEQMHAGLKRSDNEWADGAQDVRNFVSELSEISDINLQTAPVGLVFDYESAWAWDTQPQGLTFDYFKLVYDVYRGLRRLGLSVDILPPSTTDFGERRLVCIPGLFTWSPELKKAVSKFSGQVLMGPRFGSKTPDFNIPETLPPNVPGFACKVKSVETLRPSVVLPLKDGGGIASWREFIETSEEVTEKTEDGNAVLIVKANIWYLAGWPDDEAMIRLLGEVAKKSDLETFPVEGGQRRREFGPYVLHSDYDTGEIQIIKK
ncbi:beta-galactosidase [Litorimonas cladophorae]|uniref:Beta-galactosidase n=1 Tax=Litorimonas cladophorae TaxID=1220491 RepID=A0A918KPC0_9PROT|nr:beta-galactosidase [Litorimonas cladophorae]GGX70902.1 beta-galactosidase [Litorimonas cladophorae]